MEKSIFEWYNDKANKISVNAEDVIEYGQFVPQTYYTKEHYVFDGITFFKKIPHSREYKTEINTNGQSFIVNPFASVYRYRDNQLSTQSELIAEKKYRALGFVTARHLVVEGSNQYYLISPDLFGDTIYAKSMFDMFSELQGRKYSKRVQKTYSLNFTEILENKALFLEYMTEECYDRYVNFLLQGVFDFSNDDHGRNIMLVKRREAEKFEDLFVFDKESTAFNFMIAQGLKFGEIQRKLKTYCRQVGVIISSYGIDSLQVQEDKLKQLLDKGTLSEKHIKLLQTISEIDYDKLATEVENETGIKKNKVQVQAYEYGAERARKIYERIK